MKKECFYFNDNFCYKHFTKIVDVEKCAFKDCDNFKTKICQDCLLFIEKTCVGNGSFCERFKRKKGWVFDEDE